MSEQRQPPIFCDHCPSLALAELDGAPLCMTCLLREVAYGGGGQDVLKMVSPLVLAPSREVTPIPEVAPLRSVREVDGAVLANKAALA